MKKQKLDIAQCIKNAKIFLNLFGFVLDKQDNILRGNEVVGKLTFEDNRIVMNAHYNDFDFRASYQFPEVNYYKTDEDYEYNECDSKILFIATNKDIKYSGDITLSSFSDIYGRGCALQSTVYIQMPNGKLIIMEMNRDGNTFSLDSIYDSIRELIEVKPFDKNNGYIKHTYIDGSYEHFIGICSPSSDEESRELTLFERETAPGYDKVFHNQSVSKCGPDCSGSSIIQKGMLMNIIDEDMFKIIKSLRDLMIIGNVSLFDNLVSTSYDNYSREEIRALLGIDRKTFYYQDGNKKLSDSYYEPLEERPKVYKKENNNKITG